MRVDEDALELSVLDSLRLDAFSTLARVALVVVDGSCDFGAILETVLFVGAVLAVLFFPESI